MNYTLATKPLKINMYAKHIYDTDVDESLQTYEGTLKTENDTFFIQYEENGGTTYLKIDQKRQQMTILKKGTPYANLKFKKNASSKAEYQTPFGKMDFDIIVKEFNITVNEALQVSILYDLLSCETKMSTTLLSISAPI